MKLSRSVQAALIAVASIVGVAPGARGERPAVTVILPESVQFLIVALHHPPVADIQTRLRVDHNPRSNEIALADYLAGAARTSRARFLVASGHIHNYERFLRDDVVYLVSGGGGAMPYEVDRTPADLYQDSAFRNFHYVKLTIADGAMKGAMSRLDDPAGTAAGFRVKDTFELQARPSGNRSAAHF